MSDIEVKVKNLETKVNTIENSRDIDSEAVEHLNKKQKEIDDLLSNMKNLEQSQSKNENVLKSQVLDMQCRSMRDNLIFYRIPEQREETDDDCVQKILTFIEDNLKIQNARTEIKLHGLIVWDGLTLQKYDRSLPNSLSFRTERGSGKAPDY